MYYRRKILLALLEAFDNRLDKISLQKLLLLVSKHQQKPDFHFVPYKYGCYSFQAKADLQTMAKYNQVVLQCNDWVKTDSESYMTVIKEQDRHAIRYIKQIYGNKTSDGLIRITYEKYPELAINSVVAEAMLSADKYRKVVEARPQSSKTVLYTIGYEGLSLEEYINKLIAYDVKVLCDVRKNSYSMKFGFSKSQLQAACVGVGIEFVHIPQLGIDSDKRQELVSQADYDKLFAMYRADVLTQTREYQDKLMDLLSKYKRIALTCFEANICQCHRTHLANAISKNSSFVFEVKHL